MVEKIKADVDRLLLVSKMKRISILAKSIESFFSLSIPKGVYLHPILPSLHSEKRFD